MATLTWAAPDQFHFRSETAEEGGVDLFEIMGADGQVWFRHSDADDSWKDAKADGFEVRGSWPKPSITQNVGILCPIWMRCHWLGKQLLTA